MEDQVTGRLDWKWIGIGALIMLVLNLVAGFLLALILRSELEGVTEPEAIQLTGGQTALVALISFLSFAIGGYIVGIKSVGRTIVEPGISAAIAVLVSLLISGGFSLINLIVGGVVPFLAGVIGGWLGERRQSRPGPT
jgi:ABC-type dipeptide/oligopeptide/nickel transport system permease subunit